MSLEVKAMEIKKTQVSTKTVESVKSETVVKMSGWKNFLSDIKDEFKKITWTTPEELRLYTKIVVGMTVICGLAIYLLDIIIQSVLGGLNFFMRLIGG